MATLRIGLYAEGPTDQAFLPNIITREAWNLIAQSRRGNFDVAEDVVPVPRSDGVEGILQTRDAINVMCLHVDGAGDPEGALQNVLGPIEVRLRAQGYGVPLVRVVPVREIEAWALVDPSAICSALGRAEANFRYADLPRDLNLMDHPAHVERVPDPKRAMNDTIKGMIGDRGAKRTPSRIFLRLIAEHIRMERLHQVPQYVRFRDELVRALESIGAF